MCMNYAVQAQASKILDPNIELERVYSRTSDNGPSEKRTTSLQRTHSLLRNEITIVIVLKQPPRNGRFSIPDSGQELHSQLHFPIQNCL